MSLIAGPSSSSTRSAELSSKRTHPWSFLPVPSLYACGVGHWFTPLSLLLFLLI
jgi:hypothetical protein